MPFTVSLSGSLSKATTTGKSLLPYDLALGIGDLDSSTADELVLDVSDVKNVDLGTLASVKVLYITTNQDITIKLNGSLTAIPISKDGRFLLLGTSVTSLSITNGSVGQATIQVYAAGVA